MVEGEGALEALSRDVPGVTVFRLFSPGQRQDMTFEIMASDYASQFAALLGGSGPGPSGGG